MKAIIELQQLARKSSTDIVELVRSAYAIAYKLKIYDFADWCNAELEGYSVYPDVSCPDYRYIRGVIKDSFLDNSVQLINIKNFESKQKYINKFFVDSLPYIQNLLRSNEKGITYELDDDVKKHITNTYEKMNKSYYESFIPSLGEEGDKILHKTLYGHSPKLHFHIFVSNMELIKILIAVQKKILDWALDCEDQGILGDEWIFTDKEKEMAQNITYNINTLQNMANHNTESTINQTAQNMSVTKGDLQSLVNFLSDKGISESEIQEFKEIIEIEPNITVDGIQNSKIQQWLGKIAVGGSLVAKGVAIDVIVEAIKQFF
ncbi:hypothetical protein HK18_06810 [Commensalibacter intestini]|uniref:AbiTii domain-containing protein n=1 Tax=Commensalibacter intestini TaxID=479936 RepID=A0A251ZVD5_9PROT|nr:hypothetical protein [Commensalibacter intestini]OUI78602.1 hypothetical protein HK18_06810 [Commensalibacter intestini]